MFEIIFMSRSASLCLVPSPEALDNICTYIQHYLDAHPDRRIVVHCLHGRNRTFCVMMWWMCVFHQQPFSVAHANFVRDRGGPTRPHLVAHMRNLITARRLKVSQSNRAANRRPTHRLNLQTVLPSPNLKSATAPVGTSHPRGATSNYTTGLPFPFAQPCASSRESTELPGRAVCKTREGFDVSL